MASSSAAGGTAGTAGTAELEREKRAKRHCAVRSTKLLNTQAAFAKPAHEQRSADELAAVLALVQRLQQFEGLCASAQHAIAQHAQLLVLQQGLELSG